MRRLILILLLVIGAAIAWFMFRGAETTARGQLTGYLQSMGFKDAVIDKVAVSAHDTVATAITLETTKIDQVESIAVSRGWMDIFSSRPQDIKIVKPDLYRTVDHVNDILPALLMLNRHNLAFLPAGRVIVQNGRVSMNTPLGLFQFLFDIIIEPAAAGRRVVQVTVKSTEKTLDFNSEWRGWLDADGTILMDALIPEIKADIGPVRLTRGNGWLSLSNAGKYPSLTGQIESGAASLNSLPLQNFALTIDAARDAVVLLTRAQATGATRTSFAADISLDQAQKAITLTLQSNDLPEFFRYLETTSGRSAAMLQKTFEKTDALRLSIDYQLHKRFPGGPYPFDMRGLANGDEEFLSGTFLIYPGTYDMRGSAKIAKPYLPGIADYFKLPESSVSGDYVRLDAQLSPLLGISAGVENDLGEGP